MMAPSGVTVSAEVPKISNVVSTNTVFEGAIRVCFPLSIPSDNLEFILLFI